jgi:hypothetical protein
MNKYLSLQGNVGLGMAIAYFTSKEIPISIPLNDTQKYDLVVDLNNKLQRVDVKTSTNLQPSGSYSVQLRNTGGSSGKSKIRLFDNTKIDYLFILTGNGKMYLIPSKDIEAINSISVGNKYSEYEVKINNMEG